MSKVFNYLRIQGEDNLVQEILTAIADKAAGVGSIDFNAITPEPAWVYRGSVDRESYREHGRENCWNVWRMENWNSLYNSLDPERSVRNYGGRNTIVFYTQHDPVPMLMKKLSMIFPDVYIDYLWGSEDVDQGGGAIQYKAGEETVKLLPESGTRLAYEIAFDALHTTPMEHGLVLDEVTGTYELKGGLNYERCEH